MRAGAWVGLAVAGLVFGVIEPAAAQTQPRNADAATARYERQTRRLEAESRIDPGSAAREARVLRRRLISDGGGVASAPDRARLTSRLEEIQKRVPPTEPGQRETPDRLTRGDQLPASYERDADPSVRREIRLVSRLLDRAGLGLRENRTSQAQSDLSVAETSLAGLTDVAPEAELASLNKRFGELSEQVAAKPAQPPASDDRAIDDDLSELEQNPTQPNPAGS